MVRRIAGIQGAPESTVGQNNNSNHKLLRPPETRKRKKNQPLHKLAQLLLEVLDTLKVSHSGRQQS